MKPSIIAAAAIALLIPGAGIAHEYVTQKACTDTVSSSLAHDCVRVDTDTEFEDGVIVTLDGDDSDPRGDDISDGYIAVHVRRDGATVYCEDEGGFNHIDERDGGTDDDDNDTNEECDPRP